MILEVTYRRASADDASNIAALHADSWRRYYRIAYSDAYLDGDLLKDRLEVWVPRCHASDPGATTVVAEHDRGLVGFVHVVLSHDPTWGALVDNLHVLHTHQRRGIGERLMEHAAAFVAENAAEARMYLWVLDENRDAQAFYKTLGGEDVECTAALAPDGNPSYLKGEPKKRRIAWRDAALLRTHLQG